MMHLEQQAVLTGLEQNHHVFRGGGNAPKDFPILDLDSIQPELRAAIAAEAQVDVTRRFHRDLPVEIADLVFTGQRLRCAVLPIRFLLPT